ncbi:MAG: energy transducer TonB [Phyllobacteriaceae bacterium]|nr:energy transducer TonB [Phyllobacteriaceae bacterium]
MLESAGQGRDRPGPARRIGFNVSADGKVDGAPKVLKSSGSRQFDESALRAVRKCDSKGLLLPEGKAEIWAEVIVHFDPAEMF